MAKIVLLLYIMTDCGLCRSTKHASNQFDEAFLDELLYILDLQDIRGLAVVNDFRLLAAAATILLLTGCGGKTGESEAETSTAPPLTAATLGEQTVLSVSEHLAAAPYATADRSKGAKLAQVCRACHSFDKGGANMIGPALYGFFGADAGSHEGFEYSPALRSADFVWTPRALDAWLAQPGLFLPGNRMTFAGVSRQADRDALIAYLMHVSTADDNAP